METKLVNLEGKVIISPDTNDISRAVRESVEVVLRDSEPGSELAGSPKIDIKRRDQMSYGDNVEYSAIALVHKYF